MATKKRKGFKFNKLKPKTKKVTGGILAGLGIVLLVFGFLISAQVIAGEKKIRRAQKGVHTVRRVSSVHPATKSIGRAATHPVKQKIKKGKKEAATFRVVSILFIVFGGVFVLSGGYLLYDGFTSKKRRR